MLGGGPNFEPIGHRGVGGDPGQSADCRGRRTWVQISSLLLTSCVTPTCLLGGIGDKGTLLSGVVTVRIKRISICFKVPGTEQVSGNGASIMVLRGLNQAEWPGPGLAPRSRFPALRAEKL